MKLLCVVAFVTFQAWAGDHYTWVYRTVIDRSPDIGRIMRDRKLLPPR